MSDVVSNRAPGGSTQEWKNAITLGEWMRAEQENNAGADFEEGFLMWLREQGADSTFCEWETRPQGEGREHSTHFREICFVRDHIDSRYL